jgi:rubrerythrin
MENAQLKELLLQSLENERSGEKLYEAAAKAAQNEELKEEWTKYLGETRHHVEILEGVLKAFGIDTEEQSPGRDIVASLGRSLLQAVEQAVSGGNKAAAQIVAAECVVLAETKDHLNWELLGECLGKLKGEERKALQAAYDEVEDQEDEHLYHTKGWCRELWMESLGMKAQLPPPEERRHVKTAIGAARAEQARKHH